MQQRVVGLQRGFDWNDIPVLLALAQRKSMRGAAEQLGVDVSTISRRLAAAESRLQTRLFIRSPEGYEATDAGRIFMEKAAAIEGDVRALIDVTRAESESHAGEVRITSVDILIDHWLTPRIPQLLESHPDISLRMIPDNQVLSFTHSEADLALRIARPTADAAILMRRVGHIGMAVYGASEYSDIPKSRWGDVPWLAFDDDLAEVQEMQWLKQVAPSASYRFRSSSASTLLRACQAGLGIGLLPCFAAEAAGLCRLSEGVELRRELWLLRHRDATRVPRFRAVADWMADLAEAQSGWLGGTVGKNTV